MKPFKRTYIEITNTCNLACSFCDGTTRTPAFMPPENFEKILINSNKYTKHIYFHVLGEPLLHPNLDTLLDLAGKYGKLVNLTTNGVLLSNQIAMLKTKNALRQLTISLQSFTGEKSTICIDDYLKPVIEFCNLKNPDVFVSLRLLDYENDFSNPMELAILSYLKNTFEIQQQIRDLLKIDSSIPLGNNCFINIKKPFSWPNITDPNISETGYCLGLRTQIAILVDGSVVPCCLDRNGDITFGNVLTEPLESILNKARAKDIYEGFSNQLVVEPLCKKCRYRLRFSKNTISKSTILEIK